MATAAVEEIRIGVRVALAGRALKVVGLSSPGVEPARVYLEDELTGERYVVTTRVLRISRVAS